MSAVFTVCGWFNSAVFTVCGWFNRRGVQLFPCHNVTMSDVFTVCGWFNRRCNRSWQRGGCSWWTLMQLSTGT